MKNDEIKLIESESSINDNVVYDVKPKKGFKKFKAPKLSFDTYDAFLIPIALGTAISFGFLIAQLAKYAGEIGNQILNFSSLF